MSGTSSDTDAAKAEKPGRNRHRLLSRILIGILALPFIILACAVLFLYLPPVQHAVRGMAVDMLSERIGTPVSLERLYLRFPLGLYLKGLHLEDERGDTLLYAGDLRARVSPGMLFRGELLLSSMELSDVRASLHQDTDSVFNFGFIAQAFAADGTALPKESTDDAGEGFRFALGRVRLHRIHLGLHLEPSDLSLDLRLGTLAVDFRHFALAPMAFHVDDLVLRDTRLDLRNRSGEPTPPAYPALENPLEDLDVRFRRITMENVAFSMKTTDTGDSLWLGMQRAGIVARDADLVHQRLAMERVDIGGVAFGMLTHARGTEPDAASPPPPWLDQQDGFRYWTQDWDLAIDRLRITDGRLDLHTDSIVPPTLLFDPSHIRATGITLDTRDLQVGNERIASGSNRLVVHLGLDETPLELGLSLDATPATVLLSDGMVKSRNNKFSFRMEARPGDLSTAYRGPYDIPIDAEASATLRPNELLPLLRSAGIEIPSKAHTDEHWETRLWLTGTPRSAERFGLHLTGDQGSRVRVEGHVHKADSWPYDTFELRLDELTMGRGMRQLIQAYAPLGTVLPQRLSMRGSASGAKGTVKTVLAMDSDLGRVTGLAVVKDWSGPVPDDLDLALTVTDLDLATFTGDTAFGPASFKVIAGGEHLNSSLRKGMFTLTPTRLDHTGNDLSSLRLSAHVQGETLGVDLSAQAAPADILLKASGRWPGPEDSLALDLDLVIRRLHLRDLGATPHTLNINGRILGRMAFSTEGHGTMALRGEGSNLSNEGRTFRFERFLLRSLLAKDSTAIEVDSDAFTLEYHANLGIDSLLPRTQAKVRSFFQEEGAFTPIPGRRMDLAITLPRTEWLTDIVVPGLEAIELRTFKGHYDSDADELRLDIDIPHVHHAGTDIHGLKLNMDAVASRLNGTLLIDRVEQDLFHLENLSLEARSTADTLRTILRIQDNAGSDQYRIGASLSREQGVPVVHMDEEFLLDQRRWTAHPENALRLTSEGVRADHFELASNGERLALRTGRHRNHIEITGLRLSTLTEMVGTRDSVPFIAGIMDGTLSLPFVDEGRSAANIVLRELAVMGVPLGALELQASEAEAGRYQAQATLSGPHNHVRIDADADLSGTEPRVHADADIGIGDLSFLGPFVSEYLFRLEGGLSGRLRYVQEGKDVRVLGRTTFDNATVGVIQTGSVHRLPKESMTFDEQGLLFENVTVLDSVGNRFRLDGRVLTHVHDMPKLDLRLRTERFQLVNSTIEQNDMFFGDLFASIDLRIGGTAISPTVQGDVGILNGTDLSIVLPGSAVELIEHEGIVLFTDDFDPHDTLYVNTDSEMLRDSLAAQLPGVEMDLRIRLDERAMFAVVIDPTTGDQATLRGKADLVFRYAPDGDMFLSGPFTIAEGGYTLEFYGLVKKRFQLTPGGTVIWDGDPLKGRMDIQARHRADAAPLPLLANARGGISESERNRLQARLPFDVLINISGPVDAPVIGFGLALDRMTRNSFPQVSNRLDQLAQPANEDELNRQVFGLLVLNTFIQDDAGSGQPGSGLATTAARNSVNSMLTQQLNRLTGQVVRGMDVQLGVSTYDQAEGGETYQRTAVDYKVSQRLMNDRVTIEAGGSIGMDERADNVSAVSNNRAAQYAIMYDLTKDGRLRLRVFHENAFDLYDGEIFNNGIAILLSREFEENARDRQRRRQEILRQREAIRTDEER